MKFKNELGIVLDVPAFSMDVIGWITVSGEDWKLVSGDVISVLTNGPYALSFTSGIWQVDSDVVITLATLGTPDVALACLTMASNNNDACIAQINDEIESLMTKYLAPGPNAYWQIVDESPAEDLPKVSRASTL